MTTAINECGIPFGTDTEQLNAETLEAIREIEYLKAHPEEGKSYRSAEELKNDVLKA